MARLVRDTNLETRASRARLAKRAEPYWRALDQGLHVGYRRRANGGSWTVRRRKASGGYAEAKLGAADDIQDADGNAVLDYRQALDAARRWYHDAARQEAGLEAPRNGPYTVADAIGVYLAYLASEGRLQAATRDVVAHHILPALGSLDTAKLTTRKIADWHRAIASSPPHVRGARGKAAKPRAVDMDADRRRRRRATANRVLTVLKAALNRAWKDGRIASDTAWRKVTPFHNVDSPVIRYLTEAECVRLVNACDLAFRPMVRAALLTGCRYGELAALCAADYNPDAGTLTIRTSKSGKPRHVVLTDEGRDFFAHAAAGHAGSDTLFQRPDGRPWGESHQQRPLVDACRRANIVPAVSFHVLRHTHGSMLAMRGVPLPVIAQQLGHADSRMTEKHYAHLSPGYVSDTIRAHFPTLGIVESDNVRAFAGQGG